MSPAVKKAGTAPPARSREITNPTEVMLEITEDHSWLNEYTLSDEPGSDNDCKAVKTQPLKVPSTFPVLKVTGRQGSEPSSTVYAEKRMEAHSSTPSGGSTSNGQSVLKAADDHSTRGEKPPSPVATCRVNSIRTLSSLVRRTSTEDVRQTAKMSPIRPPREKRLRLEISRVDLNNPVPVLDTADCPASRKRIPTIEWVSREMKEEVEQAIQSEQECRLCSFKTSKTTFVHASLPLWVSAH